MTEKTIKTPSAIQIKKGQNMPIITYSELGLTPCPFCGGNARLSRLDGLDWVECQKCKIHSVAYSTESGEAKRFWNKRVDII